MGKCRVVSRDACGLRGKQASGEDPIGYRGRCGLKRRRGAGQSRRLPASSGTGPVPGKVRTTAVRGLRAVARTFSPGTAFCGATGVTLTIGPREPIKKWRREAGREQQCGKRAPVG